MRVLISYLLFSLGFTTMGQDTTSTASSFAVSGYLKDMQWATFNRGSANSYFSNLIHNRLNVRWRPSNAWSFRLEFRNRFYAGDAMFLNTNVPNGMKGASGWDDLAVDWTKGRHHFLKSEMDRCLVEFRKAKWTVAAGRQRINWAVNTIWNPNDIFNSYRLLDFDYEERPGSDALSVRFSRNPLSGIEAVSSLPGIDHIMALRYLTHWEGNDIQLIAGRYKGSVSFGAGWAGNWGNTGCKGELQFFEHPGGAGNQLNLSAELDHIFKGNRYLSLAALYSRNGTVRDYDPMVLSLSGLSPENLMPFRWNLLLHFSQEIDPILIVKVSVIYSPGSEIIIFLPSLNYNWRPDLDLDFFWQSFFHVDNDPEGLSHAGFLRLKWSF